MKNKIWAIVLIAVLFAAAVTVDAEVRARQEPGISWTGLSSDTKPITSAVMPGDTFTETDTGRKWLYNGSAWGLVNTVTKADTVSFAAVGHTIAFPTIGMKSVTTAVTVNSDTIGFQFQGKKIGNDWGTLDNANDSTYAANETVSLRFDAPSHYDSLRVNISSKRSLLRSIIVGISKEWK
jgi:hypothetical protein